MEKSYIVDPFLWSIRDPSPAQAVLGMDILSQAKSGMGKTAVFVLATLQQIEPVDGQVSVLVMCHTRYTTISIMLDQS